ncbi:ComEC/Rec2 family competence protein [Dechloromonas hortensis]|uniref:ComEC/Rec2 family competence protein n=1 Tax=Dechloromonas hortensis TaxID=337779 RepID=UPI001292A930|nr:ComEC/Rec2 family competence protein [Dechloromonas hortensis]
MRLNILAFASGVLCLQMQAALPVWWPWALAGGVLLLPRLFKPHAVTRGLAILACLALGLAWASWRAELRLADQLATDWEGRDIEIVGVVAGLPQDFSHGTRFEFALEKTLTADIAVPPRIMLSYYQGNRDQEDLARLSVRPGERWRFTVRLKRPHGNANPGAFDYEAWLLERNIRATGYVRPNPPERLSVMSWQAGYVIERLRYAVRASFNEMLPAEDYPWTGILVALAVGDQKAIQVVL